MMMRRLGLTLLALMSAVPVLADPPPATAPPYRPSSGALIPVAIYDAQGNIVASPGLAATSAAISPAPVVVRAAASLVAKTAASNLYGFSFTQGATAGFLAILDAAAAPAAGAPIAPVECIPVAASSGLRARHDIPDRYTTGIVALSTSSCTAFTAVTPLLMSVVAQ